MNSSKGQAGPKPRAPKTDCSKEERQHQLIQATIRSVAQNGLSDTTMATVSSEAGLSQGIINLHFQSKERLLVETLRTSLKSTAGLGKGGRRAGDSSGG